MPIALNLIAGPPIAAASTDAGMAALDSPALHAVIRERLDQVERHGYDAAHDDAHTDAEIGRGALAYLVAGIREDRGEAVDVALEAASEIWPFEIAGLRPTDYAGNLIKAAAMCIAEADRVIRTRGLLEYVGEARA